jgi:2,3-bisphosphoglycerate-independent phosphoglycerate mutase
LFLDGRDIAYNSASDLAKELVEFLKDYENVTISSVSGRFYAMDRDNNWERIEKSYSVITSENNVTDLSVVDYIDSQYSLEKYDEFVEPASFVGGKQVSENDAVFFLNYRSDRARQMTQAFIGQDFEGFKKDEIKNLYFATMTKYYPEYSENVFVADTTPKNVLAEVISNAGLKQMHLAETEKFAHVTKFFNGGKHEAHEGETWELCPSHKVETYDLDPAMSAYEIRDVFVEKAAQNDFTVVNFANGDMVGHTGSMKAAIQTVEVLDEVVLELIAYAKENSIDLIVTADH